MTSVASCLGPEPFIAECGVAEGNFIPNLFFYIIILLIYMCLSLY